MAPMVVTFSSTWQNYWCSLRSQVGKKITRDLIAYWLCGLSFWPPPVWGQEDLSSLSSTSSASASDETGLFLEIPSVYGASKYEQKVTEAPSSVTIVTDDEIKKYGYRTLADILDSVNGFYVTSDRNYSYLGARGFGRPGDYNTRVLLLIDGHRLNDNVYEGAYIGTEGRLDVDLIDRVEIIRGPSSSLYGTNAFFGVINIITKRGRNIKGIEVSSELGSFDTYKGRITYGDRFSNGLEFLLSGSLSDSDGHDRLFFKEFNAPSTNNGIARNADTDRYYHFFTKGSFSDFTLQGSYTRRDKRIPTGAFGTVFNTRRTMSADELGYVDLKYEHEFAKQLGLMARLYYDRSYYHGEYLYDYSETEVPNLVLNQDFLLGEWWGSEAKLTKKLFRRHKFTVGGEYRDNLNQNQWNVDKAPYKSYLNDKRSSQIWALYLQDEVSILENLILNAGLRYDYYDSFGGTVNPRLALIYNLPKTSIKLIYGEAFRAPSAFEQFYVSGNLYKANPNLQPEEIKTYEFVIERYLGNHLRAAASGYYYTIDGLISQVTDPDEKLVFRNLDSVEAKGLELDLEGKWASGWEGRLSYAIQRAEDGKTGKRLTNSPQHMAKANLIVPLIQDKLFAGFEVRYMSARHTLSGRTSSDYFLTNFTLFSQNLLKGVELSGSIYNLFDQRYGNPGSGEHLQDIIEQDGRTFWVRAKYSF
jgi:outer membrane receptor for ferrienterochelin and colicin